MIANRNLIILFIISTLALTYPILADRDLTTDIEDISQEQIQAKQPKGSPLSLSSTFDGIRKSDINKGYFKEDSVEFAEGNIELDLVYYYNPTYIEGATVGLGYTATYIRWENNPWFDQTHFHTVSLILGGFSKRLERWLWKGQVSINVDANEWDISEYTNYDLLLWGRYEYWDNVGIHIGFLAETGMKMDRVYPIIGFDWTLSRSWKLSLVYPVNISLDYIYNCNWSFALASRFFDSRFRVKKNQGYSRALVRYSNVGGEFAIKFDDAYMTANIHFGYTFGGRLRIASRHNRHPHNYDLDASAYGGAEVTIKF